MSLRFDANRAPQPTIVGRIALSAGERSSRISRSGRTVFGPQRAAAEKGMRNFPACNALKRHKTWK
jgi:hypothetical protein